MYNMTPLNFHWTIPLSQHFYIPLPLLNFCFRFLLHLLLPLTSSSSHSKIFYVCALPLTCPYFSIFTSALTLPTSCFLLSSSHFPPLASASHFHFPPLTFISTSNTDIPLPLLTFNPNFYSISNSTSNSTLRPSLLQLVEVLAEVRSNSGLATELLAGESALLAKMLAEMLSDR
jgi:hypothetical protein